MRRARLLNDPENPITAQRELCSTLEIFENGLKIASERLEASIVGHSFGFTPSVRKPGIPADFLDEHHPSVPAGYALVARTEVVPESEPLTYLHDGIYREFSRRAWGLIKEGTRLKDLMSAGNVVTSPSGLYIVDMDPIVV